MIRSQHKKNSGQATVEYAIILAFVMIFFFIKDGQGNTLQDRFLSGIDYYFSDIATLINLPIP